MRIRFFCLLVCFFERIAIATGEKKEADRRKRNFSYSKLLFANKSNPVDLPFAMHESGDSYYIGPDKFNRIELRFKTQDFPNFKILDQCKSPIFSFTR